MCPQADNVMQPADVQQVCRLYIVLINTQEGAECFLASIWVRIRWCT